MRPSDSSFEASCYCARYIINFRNEGLCSWVRHILFVCAKGASADLSNKEATDTHGAADHESTVLVVFLDYNFYMSTIHALYVALDESRLEIHNNQKAHRLINGA